MDGALYKAMEFVGSAISKLPIDDRFSICNMAIEAGAKSGIIACDETTEEYIKGRVKKKHVTYHSDPDSVYAKTYEFNADEISPQIALPNLPENTKPVDEVAGIKIDQVIIGSCTNGRISDLRVAAQFLKGKKVHPSLRVIIIPATQDIYKQALKRGAD